MRTLLTLITLSIIISTETLSAQSAEEIIDKYFNAVSDGNIENWNKIKSAYIESAVTFEDVSMDPTHFHLPQRKYSTHYLYRVWPDMSLTEIHEDLRLTMRVFNVKGKRVIVFPDMSPIPVAGSVQYEPYFEFEPVIIQHTVAKSKSIKLVETKIVDSVPCFDIEMKTRDLQWHFYFSTTTFLLEYWTNSPNGDFSTLTKVYNYEKHGDLLFPMSELKKKGGQIFFTSEIKKLELNLEIPSTKFEYKEE